MGEKGIDGRILLFSTALVNRFQAFYRALASVIFGVGAPADNSLILSLNGHLSMAKAAAKEDFTASYLKV